MRESAIREAVSKGLSVYNVGKPCKKGHLSGRYVSSRVCVECHKILRQSESKEIIAKRSAKYREGRREELAHKQRIFREKNPESVAKSKRKQYMSDPEKYKKKAKEYRRENLAKVRLSSSKLHRIRSLRIVDFGEDSNNKTKALELELYEMGVLLERRYGVPHSVDHMIPLQGKLVCGLHVWNNLQIIPSCLNSRKMNKFIMTEPHEWILYMNSESLEEPSWYREAIEFYRNRGWDFKKQCYVEPL